jgi:hypothetical protein
MEELAEVLAIDFDDEGGVPKLNPRWRWEDQEQALLSSCSSLIAIVKVGESRVVQFSHSSVKEYLTSPRLATRSEDVSRYHILLEPAHTILAQACVSVLLQLDDRVVEDGIYSRSPLAPYAARHWVSHAQLGHVSPTDEYDDGDEGGDFPSVSGLLSKDKAVRKKRSIKGASRLSASLPSDCTDCGP